MSLKFAFFGTPEFATIILDELAQKGFSPSVVVTAPDAPKGRKLVMTASEVSVWASAHDIPALKPVSLKDPSFPSLIASFECELFIVAAYGKIIPKQVLGIPTHGALNVHPSLLPKFRGSSPVESAILSNETQTGVTIMLLDEEMDHGPILAQHEYHAPIWPPKGSELTRKLAHMGGALLAEVIPAWLSGLKATPQDHAKATFTKKIEKSDGLIDLAGDPFTNYKKICALDGWPGTYFYIERGQKRIRVKVEDAKIENGKLVLLAVTPEGKHTMHYSDFVRGYRDATPPSHP